MSLNEREREKTNPLKSTSLRSWKYKDGDLVFDETTKTPIFVSGGTNIGQSIERALLTAKNDNIFFPQIGLDYRAFFTQVRDFKRSDQEELFKLFAIQTIAESTPYIELVQEIRVSRSDEDERIMVVDVFLLEELSTTPISILTEQIVLGSGITFNRGRT